MGEHASIISYGVAMQRQLKKTQKATCYIIVQIEIYTKQDKLSFLKLHNQRRFNNTK